MKFDEKNIIIKDFFTEDEMHNIYISIQTPTRELFMDLYGQDIRDFQLSQEIKDKILRTCEEISGEPELELVAYQYARYEKNDKMRPNLEPHFDDFENARFTLDVQLQSNTPWKLFVEGKEFLLEDNQALTFSGTHQIHWREEKTFKDGEFVDMLFCHLNRPNDNESLDENRILMKERKQKFLAEYKERYKQ